MAKVLDTNYFQVGGWMVNKLNLKGNELMVFAIIYGFSQDQESEFKGSLNYIASWLNTTKKTVINTIAALESKGFIKKIQYEINSVKFNKYVANMDYIQDVINGKNFTSGEKITPPLVKKLHHPGEKITPPNNNNINNNINNNTKKEKDKKKKAGAFSRDSFLKLAEDYAKNKDEVHASELLVAFTDFYDMRKTLKKPVSTERTATRLFLKLDKLSGGDAVAMINILNQSVDHCWQDIYQLKNDKQNTSNAQHNTSNAQRNNNAPAVNHYNYGNGYSQNGEPRNVAMESLQPLIDTPDDSYTEVDYNKIMQEIDEHMFGKDGQR